MSFWRLGLMIVLLAAGFGIPLTMREVNQEISEVGADRQEIILWHFWGGADREVVEDVVKRFNAAHSQYVVRAVAMPGNNLDLKLFLAVTGGSPPDLINQDDPIVADWACRGALMPLDEILTKREVESLENWLVPAARRLGTYDGRLYAVCNGLDIRALYYNKSILDQQGLQPPRTIEDLDEIADRCGLVDEDGRRIRFGYLPDPRRLWAWGIVFGGKFYDEHARRVTADDERIVAALQWMTSYRHRFGTAEVSAFRQGDQSLPGKTFPLLAGRYAVIMDGQWRVRDISQAQREQELADTEYGVCPLPIPKDGVPNAGWVNGNFFLVPRGSRNSSGAWEFIKFWIGFDGHEGEAATTCVAGGWIPVSGEVMEHPTFQEFLEEQPLFKTFVELAESPNQIPTPVVPGAPFFKREIEKAAEQAMYLPDAPGARALLREASLRIQRQLEQFEK